MTTGTFVQMPAGLGFSKEWPECDGSWKNLDSRTKCQQKFTVNRSDQGADLPTGRMVPYLKRNPSGATGGVFSGGGSVTALLGTKA